MHVPISFLPDQGSGRLKRGGGLQLNSEPLHNRSCLLSGWQDSHLRSPLQHAPVPKTGEVDLTPPHPVI